MKTTLRTTCSAIALAGAMLAAPAFAAGPVYQQTWGEDVVSMQMHQGSALSRAEVMADLHLWQRAGLQNANTGEGSRMATADYQERLAEYQRMRSGPEYVAEVQRMGGDVSTVALYQEQYRAY